MLLDTYFYHLPKAIPSHTCEDIIALKDHCIQSYKDDEVR